MGQKVNPTGFRLAVRRNWESRWYATKRDFPANILEDYRIREFLKEKLRQAAVPRIFIERAGQKVRVRIWTARPGMVIGRKGDDLKVLRGDIQRVAGKARRKGVTLSTEVAPDQPTVTTDGSAAVRVAVALIAHAVAATPADGQVVVSAASRGGALEIAVCGNGVGEPATDSGPRLALVEALAELHGATLELDARPDGATIATVRVPGREAPG